MEGAAGLAEALDRALAALLLQAGYNSTVVLIGASLLGVAAGLVGTFTFLRGRALVSDALSHATLPGIVLAFMVGTSLGWTTRSLPLLLTGAALSGAAGVLAVQLVTRFTRLTEDTAIAAVLSVSFGLGVLLLSYAQGMDAGGQAGLQTFILGQTAGMTRAEAQTIAVLAAGAALAVALLFKEFRLLCFDPGFAQGLGWPVFRLDLLMAGLTVLVTVIGLQTVGLVLIVAFLIIPPVAARFWSDRLERILVIAGAIGGVSGYVGTALSSAWPRLPAGGVIVLVAGALFLVSLLLAPRRGLLAALVRRVLFRLRLARVLGLVDLRRGVAPRTGPLPVLRLWLRLSGLTDAGGGLTPHGHVEAARVEANLRLWEALSRTDASAIPDTALWGVDPVERVLPADALARLRASSPARRPHGREALP
jgi:manganese/zinc/iron transport system permease protein